MSMGLQRWSAISRGLGYKEVILKCDGELGHEEYSGRGQEKTNGSDDLWKPQSLVIVAATEQPREQSKHWESMCEYFEQACKRGSDWRYGQATL